MKIETLKESDYISPLSGAMVRFHSFTRGDGEKTSSLSAGGMISYHQLSARGTTLHKHEFPEIILVLLGKAAHLVNGERTELSGGSLLFVRPDDTHGFEFVKDEPCEMISFAFSLDLLLDFSLYLKNDFFLRRFTAPPLPPSFHLDLEEREELANQLLRLNSAELATLSARDALRVRVKSILARLFLDYFLEREMGKGLLPDSTPSWLDKLCQDMRKDNNFVKGLRVMKRLSPCTYEHLCKCFRRHLDKTPTEYINELRVSHAAALLADTDEEIFAIATDTGFESLSRFYHLFKRHYGASPAKYRQKTRKTDIPI